MSFSNWYTKYKKDSYKWRAKYFAPVLKLLTKLGCTANKVTVFRLIFVLPIAYCFYIEYLWAVLFFYLIFWLLDLVDGSLARYQQKEHDKGRFLDSVVDNFMYSFAIIGFIYLESAIVWLLAANILLELTAQILATIKKRRGQPSDWLISVTPDIPYFKSLAHAGLLLFVFGINILNPLFIFLNIWLSLTALYYFCKIRKQQ